MAENADTRQAETEGSLPSSQKQLPPPPPQARLGEAETILCVGSLFLFYLDNLALSSSVRTESGEPIQLVAQE